MVIPAASGEQIASAIGIHSHSDREILLTLLTQLVQQGKIKDAGRGKYYVDSPLELKEGRIEMTQRGNGYVIVEGGDDIFIDKKDTLHALDGDRVKINIRSQKRDGRPQGKVVEILERTHNTIVGIIDVKPKFAFLAPNNKRIHVDVFIPTANLNGAVHGQMVVAEITDWPEGADCPFGKIIKILGKPGEHATEMHAIMEEFRLPGPFSKHLIETAENLKDGCTPEEIAKRRDMRGVTTFTIDPFDAKDFDDALSVKFLRTDEVKGNIWEIGVHIADVSHYVKPDSEIDREGYNRATSVYLVDRVIPMLPERLSNELCSLRPNEDKLTYSVIFEMDEHAEIYKTWFGRTAIHSDKRFSYEDAQEIIEQGKGEYDQEILLLHKLAQIMREARMKNGALELKSTEVKFKLDEAGKPTGVYTKVMKSSNQLIEEFMLMANKAVASHVGKKDGSRKTLPMVYRIHDIPNQEKVSDLGMFVKSFGYSLNATNLQALNKAINKLLAEIKDEHTAAVIQTFAIRCMAKAVYSPENIGHFGLAFDYYSHFTSPIRRYPDLIVHRILTNYLDNEQSYNVKQLEDWCKHSSAMEKRAADAERASVKYKQVEYMLDNVGKNFPGIISGVTEWGIYVEIIENKCEGMVRIREIKDDYYVFDEKQYALVGATTKNLLQLGDEIYVKVKNADLVKKQLDFNFLRINQK
ncbi:MAG: ribonuclease R, partial [Flavobacteriales bacterium]